MVQRHSLNSPKKLSCITRSKGGLSIPISKQRLPQSMTKQCIHTCVLSSWRVSPSPRLKTVRFAPFLYTIIPFQEKYSRRYSARLSSLWRKASLTRLPQHNVDQSCTMVGHVMGPTTLVSLLHIVDPSRSRTKLHSTWRQNYS
jgi:hypothetical protein